MFINNRKKFVFQEYFDNHLINRITMNSNVYNFFLINIKLISLKNFYLEFEFT